MALAPGSMSLVAVLAVPATQLRASCSHPPCVPQCHVAALAACNVSKVRCGKCSFHHSGSANSRLFPQSRSHLQHSSSVPGEMHNCKSSGVLPTDSAPQVYVKYIPVLLPGWPSPWQDSAKSRYKCTALYGLVLRCNFSLYLYLDDVKLYFGLISRADSCHYNFLAKVSWKRWSI